MKREQIHQRQSFDYDAHARILAKSNGLCARCGKHLSIKKMTIEHVIPLSKGGTHEESNLLALCLDCNQEKRDYIVSPRAYYNYVPEDVLMQIQEHYFKYLDNVEWYGKYNYTKEDKKLIPYKTLTHGRVVKTKNGHMTKYFPQYLTLEKAYVNNLEEVIDFIKDYHKKNSISNDDIDSIIWDYFQNGCIYKLHRKGEIIAVIPLKIAPFTSEEGTFYQLTANGVMCKYKKPEYISAIANAIFYITDCLSETNHEGLSTCILDIYDRDPIARAVVDELKAYEYGELNDDGFKLYKLYYVMPPSEDRKESEFLYEQTLQLSEERKLKIISEGFERKLHLTPLKKIEEYKTKHEEEKQKYTNSGGAASARAPKKKKRIKKVIDEYDLEYYKH